MVFIHDSSEVSKGDKMCFAHQPAHGGIWVRVRKMVQKKTNSDKMKEILKANVG